jgi:tetratricopeptide (TPR) repeat protein
MWLQPAAHERFETGAGFAHAGLIGRDKTNPSGVSDVRVKGEIIDFIDSEGRRQFTGSNSASYWTTRGASGSPVFLDGGQQLAGIMSLSETGANEGETHLHEAFVVPATTIHKYLRALFERLAADQQVEKRGVDPARLQPILAKVGQMDVPDDKIAERLDASVEDILAQAAKPVAASNDGADIDAVVAASREKLGTLDTAGALDVLGAKTAEEEPERGRRLVPLLKERAAVERLAFDYDSAKQSLTEVTRLAPDDIWAFIDLGDLYLITGPLEEAATAFRNAEAAARRQDGDRDLSVACERIGDVQVAQSDLAGALKSYNDSLAIRERLAKSDPGHALWQSDLSVSYDRVGDVQKWMLLRTSPIRCFSDSIVTDGLEMIRCEGRQDFSMSMID